MLPIPNQQLQQNPGVTFQQQLLGYNPNELYNEAMLWNEFFNQTAEGQQAMEHFRAFIEKRKNPQMHSQVSEMTSRMNTLENSVGNIEAMLKKLTE